MITTRVFLFCFIGVLFSVTLNAQSVPAAPSGCPVGQIPQPNPSAASNQILYKGWIYQRLDGAYTPDRNGLDSCTGSNGYSEYRPLPTGWSLAPDTPDTQTVIGSHYWNTRALVTASGNGYYTKEGFSQSGQLWASNFLSVFNDLYAPSNCPMYYAQVLIAKPASCSVCPPGSYASLGSTTCTQCPAGTYTNMEGSALCKPCSGIVDESRTICTLSAPIVVTGSNVVIYNDKRYRTLDNADPWSTANDCHDYGNFVSLPTGFIIAPDNAESRLVAASFPWGTSSLVMSNWNSYFTQARGSSAGGFDDSKMLLFKSGKFSPVCRSGWLTPKRVLLVEASPILYDSSSRIVIYGGNTYRTLDNINVADKTLGRQRGSIRIPEGWSIAPNNHDSQIVASSFSWGTAVMVLGDGKSYWTGQSGNIKFFRDNWLGVQTIPGYGDIYGILGGGDGRILLVRSGIIPSDEFVIQWKSNPNHVLNNAAKMSPFTDGSTVPASQRYRWNGYQLQLSNTNQCLDVYGGAINTDGYGIFLYPCGPQINQQFIRRGSNMIQSRGSNKCIDVPGGNTAFDTPINIYQCTETNHANQQFNLISASMITIKWTANPDHYLSYDNAVGNAVMTQYSNSNTVGSFPSPYQLFVWTADNQIQLSGTELCLTVKDGAINNDVASLIFTYCTPTNDKQFIKRGYHIQVQASSKCMDVPGGNTAFGTAMIIYQCDDTNINQIFTFDTPLL